MDTQLRRQKYVVSCLTMLRSASYWFSQEILCLVDEAEEQFSAAQEIKVLYRLTWYRLHTCTCDSHVMHIQCIKTYLQMTN